MTSTLYWRHNERDEVSNHRRFDCLLNRLFRCRLTKISNLCVTGLCEWNLPVTGGFSPEKASNAEMFPFEDVITNKLKILGFEGYSLSLVNRGWVIHYIKQSVCLGNSMIAQCKRSDTADLGYNLLLLWRNKIKTKHEPWAHFFENVVWPFNPTVILTGFRSQIANFMGPTWGQSGSCRPQMGPM